MGNWARTTNYDSVRIFFGLHSLTFLFYRNVKLMLILLIKVWREQHQNACRAQDIHRKRRELACCHVLGATGDVGWFTKIPRMYHHNYTCTVSEYHANRKSKTFIIIDAQHNRDESQDRTSAYPMKLFHRRQISRSEQHHDRYTIATLVESSVVKVQYCRIVLHLLSLIGRDPPT